MHSITRHVIVNLPRFVQQINVGINQHVISSITAAAHHVKISLDAVQAKHLIIKHVVVLLLKYALQKFVGTVFHVILSIVVVAHHVLIGSNAYKGKNST